MKKNYYLRIVLISKFDYSQNYYDWGKKHQKNHKKFNGDVEQLLINGLNLGVGHLEKLQQKQQKN